MIVLDPPLMSIRDVSVSFGGVKALRAVSFEARRGELLAIIGPNGAGKTTLFNCLSALARPGQGRIDFDGHDIVRSRPADLAKLGIGRTFQNLGLFDNFDPVENILLGRHALMSTGFASAAFWTRSARAEEREHRAAAQEISEFLELAAYAGRPCGVLPYGIRKLVELGRALAMKPTLLMLDEPVAGMNLEETERMARIVHRVREKFDTTILLVEHDMAFVMDLADRVVVLDFGEVIGIGTPDEVRANSRVVAAYLGGSVDAART